MFLDHLSSPSTFFAQLSITTSISFWDWLDSLKLIHLKACLTSLPWDDNSTDSFECLAFCVWGVCVFRYGGSHVSAGACGDFRLMLAFSWIVSYLIWYGRVSGWAQNVPFWFVWLVSLLLSPPSLPPKSWDDMWLPQALFCGCWSSKLGSPHLYGKHFTAWAISLAFHWQSWCYPLRLPGKPCFSNNPCPMPFLCCPYLMFPYPPSTDTLSSKSHKTFF